MSSQDRVFPLLDRRAPLLERVRNGRSERIGRAMADKLNDFIREEDNQIEEEEIMRIQSDFRERLASLLGVEEGQINDSVVAQSTIIFTRDEEDIIIASTSEQDSDEEEVDDAESGELFGDN